MKWMTASGTLGEERSREGMGKHKVLCTKKGLVLSCGTPIHCSTFN